MTVPFRSRSIDDLGCAAYLRIVPGSGDVWLGGMLMGDSAGEPLEFCTAEVAASDDPLWRPEDAVRRTQGGLVRALFEVCESRPRLVLALADELDRRVFSADVQPEVPACRVVPSEHPTGMDLEESATPAGPQLIWALERPESGTPARRLLNRLIDHDLVLEPFDRVEAALRAGG